MTTQRTVRIGATVGMGMVIGAVIGHVLGQVALRVGVGALVGMGIGFWSVGASPVVSQLGRLDHGRGRVAEAGLETNCARHRPAERTERRARRPRAQRRAKGLGCGSFE